MRITVLGCGTSTGVPIIGCHCEVCASQDIKNKRTRSSLLIQAQNKNILIDTSTDLRHQSLANGLERIDAVLFTHHHADHIHGIDDLRAFNLAQRASIPCFASLKTVQRIESIFNYIFNNNSSDESWKPDLDISAIDGPFDLFSIKIEPVEVLHGKNLILGFRIGKLSYVTDCSEIPDCSYEKLYGTELLILGALRHKPHPTHFTVAQALEASSRIGAKRTVLTHLSHSIDYEKESAELPKGVELAYDGMRMEI